MSTTRRRNRVVLVTPNTPYDQLPNLMDVKQAAVHTQQSEWKIRRMLYDGSVPVRQHLWLIAISMHQLSEPASWSSRTLRRPRHSNRS